MTKNAKHSEALLETATFNNVRISRQTILTILNNVS